MGPEAGLSRESPGSALSGRARAFALTEPCASCRVQGVKTVRLLYPDYLSGGLDTYAFGARLMRYLLPENPRQPLITVDVAPPGAAVPPERRGIKALDAVLDGVRDAQAKLEQCRPERVITIGGTCLVSLAPFDYLHGPGGRTGIIWLDAHPDVSLPENGYPQAHAMVLGALLGRGAGPLREVMRHAPFRPDELLYVGLQGLLDYQERFLREAGVPFRMQTESFVGDDELRAFMSRFDRLLVHLDVDVLDPRFFHATYFAHPDLVGDGSGGGAMRLSELGRLLRLVTTEATVAGLTIAEYLPFEAEAFSKMLASLPLLSD